MPTGDALRDRLHDLGQLDPSPLSEWSTPRESDAYRPPYQIRLRAWATDIAASLHAEFGADVELTLGHLTYPACELPAYRRRSVEWRGPAASDVGLRVSPVGPLTVASGHTVQAPIWVTNESTILTVLSTNGNLQSCVLDSLGRHVGCADGAQSLAGYQVAIEPGERVELPVLIGTASLDTALGYVVPPGVWTLEVYLKAPEAMASDPLPLAVTA